MAIPDLYTLRAVATADDNQRVIEALDYIDELLTAVARQRRAEEDMLSIVPMSAHGRVECALVTEWINAGDAVEQLQPHVVAVG